MKDGEKHIDYDLISKYLSGEASPEENQRIESWRDSSKDNYSEFEHLSRLWEETGSLTSLISAQVDTDAAWNRLQGRLFGEDAADGTVPEQEEIDAGSDLKEAGTSPEQKDALTSPVQKETKTINLYYYATRIAAVIVVSFLIYAIFFMEWGPHDQVQVIAENTITIADLPDDSRITLNENSKITYAEAFKTDEREVELTGEAFFEIKPIERKPFVVRAHNAIVRVLGTSFNVRAIETEAEVSVTVEEGKVRLSDEEDIVYVILERNEKGIFNRDTGHIEKYERTEGDEMFWRSRTILFRDTELSAVFRTLEKLYDTKIIIKNDKILSCVLTGKFQDMDIEDILEKIAINFNLTIAKNKNTFEISGDGC